MDHQTALDLLRPVIRPGDDTWCDVGAGTGTFTRALAELLGPTGTVHAFDSDDGAVASLRVLARSVRTGARIVAALGRLEALPPLPPLDGILLANVLHYVRPAGQPMVLARLAPALADGGRVVVIDYDGRAANPWVPYPVPRARLRALAASAAFDPPEVTATEPSAFGGVLYVATLAVAR